MKAIRMACGAVFVFLAAWQVDSSCALDPVELAVERTAIMIPRKHFDLKTVDAT